MKLYAPLLGQKIYKVNEASQLGCENKNIRIPIYYFMLQKEELSFCINIWIGFEAFLGPHSDGYNKCGLLRELV